MTRYDHSQFSYFRNAFRGAN
ncbi:MAG: hypothetical protein K0S65_6335, partial [Labilithrix sp.]|nr:hypothetical protein [Labilithrix sp.]